MLEQNGDGRFVPQPFEVDDGLRAAVAERLAAVGGAFEGAHFVRAASQSDRQGGGKFDFKGCFRIHGGIVTGKTARYG